MVMVITQNLSLTKIQPVTMYLIYPMKTDSTAVKFSTNGFCSAMKQVAIIKRNLRSSFANVFTSEWAANASGCWDWELQEK